MSDLIPKRTDEVVLYLDADQHQINALRKGIETAIANSSAPARLGDDSEVTAAAEAYDAFVTEAAARGVKVEVSSMAGRKWRAMAAEHPPRKGVEADEEWGFNFLTLGDDVVPPCVTAIGGKKLAEAELVNAIDELSDGDFSRVFSAVLRLNTGRGPDPKGSISAMLPRTSSETSESPERLG